MLNVESVGDKVIVKNVEYSKLNSSTIYLTSNVDKNIENNIYEVVDVEDNNIVHVGDKVVIQKYIGSEFMEDGISYRVVRQEDILAIVEEV